MKLVTFLLKEAENRPTRTSKCLMKVEKERFGLPLGLSLPRHLVNGNGINQCWGGHSLMWGTLRWHSRDTQG